MMKQFNEMLNGKEESSTTSVLPSFMTKSDEPKSIVPESITNIANDPTKMIPGFQEEPACAKCCPKLTFKQRIIGFASCCGFGYILSLIGSLTLIGGPTDTNIRTFICLYVFGNIIALCATGFLLGPKSQCKKMWDPTRRFSTAAYLGLLIIVFAVAVAKQNVGLVLFLLFLEVLAGTWYALSYIPFGRKAATACLKRTICKPCWDVYQESKGGGGGGASA